MCGICGVAGAHVSRENLEFATRLMRHRGPDEEGFLHENHVAFGIRRLKVIDLHSGRQPKTNEDGTIHVVFNGEIYNYKDLRTELQSHGHEFRSDSDTEVIVHAYEQWGTDCFGRLNGIFAVGIWDVRADRIILARDHVGIKPLFYAASGGALAFGSELKSLVALLGHVPEIDSLSFSLYLRYKYVPEPRSILHGVKKLQPGHYLTFDIRTGKSTDVGYWDPLTFVGRQSHSMTVTETEELVEDCLKRSEERR